jgi:hypothetical protein
MTSCPIMSQITRTNHRTHICQCWMTTLDSRIKHVRKLIYTMRCSTKIAWLAPWFYCINFNYDTCLVHHGARLDTGWSTWNRWVEQFRKEPILALMFEGLQWCRGGIFSLLDWMPLALEPAHLKSTFRHHSMEAASINPVDLPFHICTCSASLGAPFPLCWSIRIWLGHSLDAPKLKE